MNTSWGRPLLPLALLCAVLCLAGCADTQPESTARGPSNKVMLIDLAELLKGRAKGNQPPPARPADIAALEPVHPAAGQGILNREITYQWGNGLQQGGNAGDRALAWETKVETEGGWVLMQDGTLKEMTAQEFKATPRAGR